MIQLPHLLLHLSHVVDRFLHAYKSHNGILFNKDMQTLLRYPPGKQADHYDIPDGVVAVVDCSFSDCYNLNSIYIPENVISISDYISYYHYTHITIYCELGSYAEEYAK